MRKLPVWTYPQFAQQIPIDLLGVFAGTTTGTSTVVIPPAWVGGTTYVVGDKVLYLTVVYVCVLGHTISHVPPNITYWAVSTNSRYPVTPGSSNGEFYLVTDISPPQTFVWYVNTWYPLATSSGGGGGSSYVLPPATVSVLGGVIVGTGLAVDGIGTLSATATSYTLPPATVSVLGGVIVGTGLAVDGVGTLSATATPYTLPIASAGSLGGIRVGTNLSIDGSGILSGTVSAYTLPIASAGSLGGIRVGTGLSIDGSGILSATVGALAAATTTTLGGVKLMAVDQVPSGPLVPNRDANGTLWAQGNAANTGDGASVGVVLGNVGALTDYRHKMISIRANSVEVASINGNGMGYFKNGLYVGVDFGNAADMIYLKSSNNGAGNNGIVAVSTDTNGSWLPYTNNRLFAVRTGGIIKFYVDVNGNAYANGTLLGGVYSLPIASAGSLGGIRVGTNLSIDGSGILSAAAGSIVAPYTLNGVGDTVPLTINAISGQTAKLQSWQVNSGELLYVKANGALSSSKAKSNTTLDCDYFGSNEYWGFRTNTSNTFSLDLYNGGTLTVAMQVLNALPASGGGSVGFNVVPTVGFHVASPTPASGAATAIILGTANSFGAGDTVLAVKNAATQLFSIEYDGTTRMRQGYALYWGTTSGVYGNSQQTMVVQGNQPDGAAAVGVILDTKTTLANATALLLSVRNNGVEKFYIDKDGAFGWTGGSYLKYGASSLLPTYSGFQIYNSSSAERFILSDTGVFFVGGPEAILGFSDRGGTITQRWGWYSTSDVAKFYCNTTASNVLTVSTAGNLTATGTVAGTAHVPITATSSIVRGAVADGASAVGVILDNSVTLSTSGAKLLSVQNNGVEKFSINRNGSITIPAGEAYYWGSSTGAAIYGDNNSSANMRGNMADGASAIGVILNNATALATSGAKLLSVQNNSVEKAYIDPDGRLYHGITWDDMQGPANAALIGASAPTNEQYRDTLARLMFFRHDQDDSLTFTYQTSHRWIRDTEVQVHIHYIPMVTPAADQVVRIQYSYVWAHPNAAVPANTSWTTSFTDITIPTSGADTHNEKLAGLFNTTPSGSKESSILIVNITRLSSSTSDTYTTSKADNTAAANFCVLSVDAHYQSNKEGTTTAIPA
jgi:hypothetical protein